jgi:hypothetical protein
MTAINRHQTAQEAALNRQLRSAYEAWRSALREGPSIPDQELVDALAEIAAAMVDATGDNADTPWIDLVDACAEALEEAGLEAGRSRPVPAPCLVRIMDRARLILSA